MTMIGNRTLDGVLDAAHEVSWCVIEPLTTDGINRYFKRHFPDWSDEERSALIKVVAVINDTVAWSMQEAREALQRAMARATVDCEEVFRDHAKALRKWEGTTARRRRAKTIAGLKKAMATANED